MSRFTKDALTAHLQDRIGEIKNRCGFDLNNGTAQLADKPQPYVLAYGEMNAYIKLLNLIEGGYIKG